MVMNIIFLWAVTQRNYVRVHRPDKSQRKNISLKMGGDEVPPKRQRPALLRRLSS
jgi:hypothetical protein